ncbi:hypothetical protein CAC02_02675 [Streptococcus gallolyticus]|uniref:Transposase DDE domain-containing protein n=1 Tax=Streptococcus gallolyticus TaxID=315405 RepID=A0A368UFZ8_9STRE|nr:hypothetical protein CAC02_02675 [Streptococcus gallolyticus]
MFHKENPDYNRKQVGFYTLDDLVPEDHLLRQIDRYRKRKETIERLFGTAKEYHNLRYTRERGKSKMEAKVGLTLACLNLKKLAKWLAG